MRIIHVTAEIGHGGDWQSIRALAKQQSADQHEVIVAGRGVSCVSAQVAKSVRAVELHPKPFSIHNISSVFALRRLLQETQHPTVLHSHASSAQLLCTLVGRFPNIPRLSTNHLSPPLSARRRLAKSVILRSADCIIAPSDETNQQLSKEHRLSPYRIHTIPYGVDPAAFCPGTVDERASIRGELEIPANATVLGFVGRLNPEKRVHFLLDFVEVAKCAGIDVFVLIAGTGPCEESLKNAAARLAADRNIRFLGRLTDPRPVYLASDLVVLPSIYETFGIVVAESFLCGTPVFRSDSAGWSNQIVAGQTGDVFASDSKEQFNCRLLRLIEDKQALSRMAQHVRSFALSRFSLKEYSDRMVMLYQECLAERAAKSPTKHS